MVETGGSHQREGRRRGPGQPSQMSPGRHRPNEYALVVDMALHSDAVSEYRSSAYRTGWVDSQDANTLPSLSDDVDQGGYQGGLAGSRWSGDPDDRTLLLPLDGGTRFNLRDGASQGATVAVLHGLEEFGVHCRWSLRVP